MSTDVVMQLECPHCAYRLFAPVSLVEPCLSATCPACTKSFVLDPEIGALSRLLGVAHAARRERERRRVAAEAAWRATATSQPPKTLSDVLARLDELLEKPAKSRKRA